MESAWSPRARVKFAEAFAGHRTVARKKANHPNPRPCAKRQLEAARPVDPAQVGVLALPVVPLSETFLCIALVTSQSVGKRQCNKMLVAIWFPDDLTVTHLWRSRDKDTGSSVQGPIRCRG